VQKLPQAGGECNGMLVLNTHPYKVLLFTQALVGESRGINFTIKGCPMDSTIESMTQDLLSSNRATNNLLGKVLEDWLLSENVKHVWAPKGIPTTMFRAVIRLKWGNMVIRKIFTDNFFWCEAGGMSRKVEMVKVCHKCKIRVST